MTTYRQLTSGERYALSALRKQGYCNAAIARAMGRHRSTIGRELKRNTRKDGGYRPSTADQKTRGRRARSRRNEQFTPGDWVLVVFYLKQLWSPQQISGTLKMKGLLGISHETIYRYVWDDRARGGTLYRYLRQALKKRRKGYFEGDTVMGSGDKHCILTLVDRRTGYVMIGKLESRTVKAVNRRAIGLLRGSRRRVRTVTLDNGTEFHGHKKIEAATAARFYFAAPYHSWERGTSENTSGLIRQYLPKRTSMADITQLDCTRIAKKLNRRPQKRLGFRTPEECYEQ